MKYNVIIHYAGAYDVEVEAENEEQAEIIAYALFDEANEIELIANLADIKVCDIIEIEEE